VAPLETPPGEDQTARPREAEGTTTRILRRGRFVDLEQHELITLLDEVDDERARARFRESIYIAVIVWLALGWVIVYGPRYLWHPPVIINAPDEKHNNLTYLDTPPDLQKQLKRIKPTPNISQHDTEAQSPKPAPQAPQPRAGTPEPPAPRPTPQPQQQQAPAQQPAPQPPQQARNTPPTPQPPQPRPQPLADAPAPSTQPNRNIFGGQQSPGQAIQQAAKGARSGEGGDYGSTGRGQQGGAKQGVQIISDTQGVDFGKYLNRLLSDVRRNWLPLIPEECRPPLNKEGITGVRFTIQPDGKISAMNLDYSTHDDAINRAAWGSITGLGQAQPLPKEFHGPNLELRIEFRINKDAPDAR
jgi:outer membrane biosynthesis protein TonB